MQTIDVFGVGKLTFPDNMSKENIAAAIKAKYPPSKQTDSQNQNQTAREPEQITRKDFVNESPQLPPVITINPVINLDMTPIAKAQDRMGDMLKKQLSELLKNEPCEIDIKPLAESHDRIGKLIASSHERIGQMLAQAISSLPQPSTPSPITYSFKVNRNDKGLIESIDAHPNEGITL